VSRACSVLLYESGCCGSVIRRNTATDSDNLRIRTSAASVNTRIKEDEVELVKKTVAGVYELSARDEIVGHKHDASTHAAKSFHMDAYCPVASVILETDNREVERNHTVP